MNNLMKNWIMTMAVMGFAVLTMGMVVNSRSAEQSAWHQYAVETVGPVSREDVQNGTLFSLRPGSALYLEGGSVQNSYQITTRSLRGSVVLNNSSSDLVAAFQTGQVRSMTLVLPVSALKAQATVSHDTLVNTFKTEDSSVIRFDLNQASLAAGKTDHTYVLTAVGTVTISGRITPVTLTADATIRDGQMFVQGVQKLSMADFGRVPHSDSLVTADAADVVEFHYGLLFEAN